MKNLVYSLGYSIRHVAPLLLFCSLTANLPGQIGYDNSFGANGRFFYNEEGTFESGKKVLEQPDGKVILIGDTDFDPDEGNNYRIVVIRLNANGTYDNSFGTNGKAYIDTPNSTDSPEAATLQPDGKILICGLRRVYRLNSNGSMDTSFGSNGTAVIAAEAVYSLYNVQVQSNGKIVVSGYGFIDTRFSYLIARFNSNGQLDNTFNGFGYIKFRSSSSNTEEDTNAGYGLAIQPDGKIVSCGYNEKYDGTVVRLTASGQLDATFASGGIQYINFTRKMYLYSVAIQPDGKILIGGNYDFSSTIIKALVFRFLLNGNYDNTFDGFGWNWYGSSGSGFGIGYDMALQCDGKIIIGGLSHLNRVLPDGNPDPTFGNNSSGHFSLTATPSNDIYGIFIGASKIYLVGNSYPSANSFDRGMAVLRLNNDINCGTTNTSDLHRDFSVTMYPNPVSDILTIQVDPNNDPVRQLLIIDPTGRTLWSDHGFSPDESPILCPVNTLPPGTYYISVTTTQGRRTLPFVKI